MGGWSGKGGLKSKALNTLLSGFLLRREGEKSKRVPRKAWKGKGKKLLAAKRGKFTVEGGAYCNTNGPCKRGPHMMSLEHTLAL